MLLFREKKSVRAAALLTAAVLMTTLLGGCSGGKKAEEEKDPDYGFAATAKTLSLASDAENGSGKRAQAEAELGDTNISFTIDVSGDDKRFAAVIVGEDGERSLFELIVRNGAIYLAPDIIIDALNEALGAMFGGTAIGGRFMTGDQLNEVVGSLSGLLESVGLEGLSGLTEAGDGGLEDMLDGIDTEELTERLLNIDKALIKEGVMTGDSSGFTLDTYWDELMRIIGETAGDGELQEQLENAGEGAGSILGGLGEEVSVPDGRIRLSVSSSDFDGKIEKPETMDSMDIALLLMIPRLLSTYASARGED